MKLKSTLEENDLMNYRKQQINTRREICYEGLLTDQRTEYGIGIESKSTVDRNLVLIKDEETKQ